VLITYVLKEKCPECGNTGQYGNVNVSADTLNRGCNACGYWNRIPLPPLKKQVLYLDQFFLSHAFRDNAKPFVAAARRIEDFANRQLLVCPYSSVHNDETRLWRHEDQERLLEFIKQTARGRKFAPAYSIKQAQLVRSFRSFLNSNAQHYMVEGHHAFRKNIHSWDDYFWVDVRPSYLADTEEMRQGKKAAVSALIDIFDGWRKTEATFDEDRRSEALGYAQSLLTQYWESTVKLATGVADYLSQPIESRFVRELLYFDEETISFENRVERLKTFLRSDYFVNTPYIDISCQLFAVLRKLVRGGAYRNREKAEGKLAGHYYDIDFVSIFGPYCDAVFADRIMRHWLMDNEANICEQYHFTAFSPESWEDFHRYLDNIESDVSEDLNLFLRMVYPRQA
jgi:hypothetical protein